MSGPYETERQAADAARHIYDSVLLVASVSAIVSFVHIEHLAVTYGQAPLAAALLPLSIDGTVLPRRR